MQELDWDSSEWIWWGPWHQAPSSAPALLQESRKLLLYPHHLDSSTFVTMLMKLPASWHISFHSGHQDSVEKYIPRLPPQLWLKQGTNPIPSPVNSSWDPNPLDCFIYLQNTVNLKAPYDPTLWQSLTFGWGGGVRGTTEAVEPDMDTEWWREVLAEGQTDREGPMGQRDWEERRERGSGRRDQLARCYVQTPAILTDNRERERGAGRAGERRAREQGRQERGRGEAQLGCTASSDLSERHRQTHCQALNSEGYSLSYLKNGFAG